MRTLAESVELALFMTDARLRCTYMNAAAEALTGRTLAEVIARGLSLSDLVRPPSPEGRSSSEDSALARALVKQTRERGEDVFVHKDGQLHPVAFTVSPLREADAVVGTLIEVRDLTVERRAAEALRTSEARYRFLAETIPVQVWTAKPDGLLDYVSSRAVIEFGVPLDTLLSEGWLNVLHPEDRPLAIERWTTALRTGEGYEVEFRLKLANGQYAWYLARAVPERDANGHILQWLGTNTNIHEQREARERTEALLLEVGKQARETEATLVRLRAEKLAAEQRAAELEAKSASR
ncbi:PAS domain S-box protein [Corallococcus praedator]|uniref:histidine kinase n=1 Tax=Corallococcus praedator TaxID=2316724 RepID=A0ABX9QR86_9BACT|nr:MULTISPECIES: PAS domain S-box protein [Corallococcus]RKH18762.1 PAS domain S-box protein [Corallococcus sp. CA047B]RKH34720.1 PAS domain S-box protein [Corallococcus sp. CA031C]RKI14615.1 PAS domain S-box protein [Corallococcus praedator]